MALLNTDVAIIGNGLSALVAAHTFALNRKSVLLLNPDHDFFLEDSEFSVDPLWPVSTPVLRPGRLQLSTPESALDILRPDFPGAIEYWTGPSAGFRDSSAPFVRRRSRIWVRALGDDRFDTETLEQLYLEASDAGLKPQILDGVAAALRFPGFSLSTAQVNGVLLPRSCDVDVSRYRQGLLEYARERLGPEHLICSIPQIELLKDGLRFYSGGGALHVRVNEGVVVCMTPRILPWLSGQSKRLEFSIPQVRGLQLWEEWGVLSRERLDPSVQGVIQDLLVWAEIEGDPQAINNDFLTLKVLRPAGFLPFGGGTIAGTGAGWASKDSFEALDRLFASFLKWTHYTVRSLRPKSSLEWMSTSVQHRDLGGVQLHLVPGADGFIVDVVQRARQIALKWGQPG